MYLLHLANKRPYPADFPPLRKHMQRSVATLKAIHSINSHIEQYIVVQSTISLNERLSPLSYFSCASSSRDIPFYRSLALKTFPILTSSSFSNFRCFHSCFCNICYFYFTNTRQTVTTARYLKTPRIIYSSTDTLILNTLRLKRFPVIWKTC